MHDDFLDDRAHEDLAFVKAHRVEPVRDGRGDLGESPEEVLSRGGLLMLRM